MVGTRFRTVLGTRRSRGFIIRGIAVREAVRHDEIHHIILRKSLKLSQRRGADSQRQFESRRSLRRGNSADGSTRLGVRPDLQPDEEIVPACRSLRARDAQRWQIAPHVGGFQIVPAKQKHHLRRKSHPPARRFHFCDRRSRFVGCLLRTGPQGRTAAGECDRVQKQEEGSEKTPRRKMAEIPVSIIHGESIRKKKEGCQPGSFALLRPMRYFLGRSDDRKTNSPNASGTWKLGAGVRVGCQAE